ncbi:MAG: polysaccharide biosynthesis tyrosine autokinase [Acidobacteriaceae bacterium]
MDPYRWLEREQNSKQIVLAETAPLSGSHRSFERERERSEGPALRIALRTLRKRLWAILLVLAVAVTFAVLISLKAVRQYDASTHIAISKEANNSLRVGAENESGAAFDYNIELDTQAAIIRGPALALEVIEDLDLAERSAFNPKFAELQRTATGQPRLSPEQESGLLGIWDRGLAVTKVPRTRMLEIRFTSSDPRLAAQIANALTNAYVERNFKTKYESTMHATQWLSRQLAELQLKVEVSEQALVNYQKSSGIVGLDEKQNITTAKLSDINKDLTSAESERMQKQAIYELAKKEPANLSSLASNLLFQRLRETESDLERQYAQLSTQFGPSYPRVLEVNNQLRQAHAAVEFEIERAVGRARNEYESSFDRERMLGSALERQKVEASQLNEESIEYLQLKREAESNRTLYDSLNQKLKEASVTSSLKLSNVNIVDTARVPSSPSSPNVRGNIALGVIFGLLGGIVLAMLLEALDNTVRTPEQVEEISALPALGTVPLTLDAGEATGKTRRKATAINIAPHAALRKQMGLISFARPKSKVAESYRALRTSILLSSIGHPPQVLMLTSALPQEGKTTTSVNTAIVLAQKGGRVLLIDGDMRRPSIHQIFGIRALKGLSSILSGSSSFEEAVVTAPEIHNLDLLPAGPQPPNPAELLGSSHLQEFLLDWRDKYDFIVVDTPPVLSVTDAVLLSARMDSVILVVRSGRTTKDALRRARQLFDQVNVRVMGVVVNAVDPRSPDAQYYGYGYGSSGSRSYYDEADEADAAAAGALAKVKTIN